jgi:hypothetical protein
MLSVDPDDFEIISIQPPIKSAVAFIPVTSRTTTTTTTRRTTATTVRHAVSPLDEQDDGPDFELINLPLRSNGPAKKTPPPPPPSDSRRVSQRVTDESQGDSSRVIFPDN